MDNKTYEYVEDRSMTIQQYINNIFKWMVIGVLTTFVTAFALEKSSFMSYAGMLPFILIICGCYWFIKTFNDNETNYSKSSLYDLFSHYWCDIFLCYCKLYFL